MAGDEGARIRRGALGLGMLLGGATFAHGWSRGCGKAEILAIDDDEAWHQRLVRYYRHFGFVPVARVTGGRLADLPHMLVSGLGLFRHHPGCPPARLDASGLHARPAHCLQVWGGAGTRMDADIPAMLRRWTAAIRAARAQEARQERREQAAQQLAAGERQQQQQGVEPGDSF